MVQHDCIISALHVFDSSSEAVAICWVGACGTGVGFVEAQSMCPAVVHVDAIIGGNGCQGGSLGDSGLAGTAALLCGGGASLLPRIVAALALWNPPWPVVSL